MGGLKGGEGELAADGGGAGPLGVSHNAELEKMILRKNTFRFFHSDHLESATAQSWKDI